MLPAGRCPSPTTISKSPERTSMAIERWSKGASVRVTREQATAQCEQIFQRFWDHQLRRLEEQAETGADLLGGKAMNTRLLMTLQVTVAAAQNIGAVPHGTRRTAPLSGGSFEGPRLRGTVLPGGSADWLLLRVDGVLELDLRATLRTDDGAL